jgi:hypothetical protein
MENKIKNALEIAKSYGWIDGAHHKMWVIDQMVRALTEDNYIVWTAEICNGGQTPSTKVEGLRRIKCNHT